MKDARRQRVAIWYGKMLRAAREKLGLTKDEVALRLLWSAEQGATIHRYEQGRVLPSVITAEKLKIVLGVEVPLLVRRAMTPHSTFPTGVERGVIERALEMHVGGAPWWEVQRALGVSKWRDALKLLSRFGALPGLMGWQAVRNPGVLLKVWRKGAYYIHGDGSRKNPWIVSHLERGELARATGRFYNALRALHAAAPGVEAEALLRRPGQVVASRALPVPEAGGRPENL